MKIILQDSRRFILRFDKGEELFASLKDFLVAQNINSAMLSGIGTCTQVVLGFYNKEIKDYEKHIIDEDLEVLNLSGNAASLEGKPALHLHGSFGKQNLSTIGGHVFSLTVAATLEINLIALTGTMERTRHEDLKLNLLV